MEIGPMEECRSLLNRRNNSNFFQRIRRNRWNLPSERYIGFGVLLSLLLCVVLIMAMQVFTNRQDTYIEEDLLIEDDELYNFSSSAEKKLFQLEWKRGRNLLAQNKKIQEDLAARPRNSSTGNLQELFSRNQNIPELLTQCAYLLEHMKRVFKRCINPDVLPDECKRVLYKTLHCNPRNPYRSFDGSCNNLANPSWGMKDASFLRWLKPDYADDVSLPRMSVYGVALPNARLLSSKLYGTKVLPDAQNTMMFVNFGLFLDHDVARSAQPTSITYPCCSPEVQENPFLRHPQCYEIEIPKWDAFYIPLNVTCMNFYRDSPGVGKCPGRREHLNVMTSYIDASDVYGPTDEELNRIRHFKGGKLHTSLIGNTPLLPLSKQSDDTCYTTEFPYKCFQTGDIRSNMHLELMTLHTIWFREHNRLTDELQRYNPHWSDEILFQEARRIAIAELQLITYREFLPIIFGQEKLKEYGLEINENETYDGYDETINAGIYNGFAAGAFRLGHSWIQDVIELRGPQYKLRSVIPFHKTFMNPSVLYKLGYDDILRGMVAQRSHQTDIYVTKEVRNRLLQKYYQDHGFDLTAISIQRGRDRGLPGYTKWRKFCGLPNVTSWEDMLGIMDKERVEDLQAMYMSVDDVDLIPAGLAEHHVKGAFVGPTYLCLLGKQFHALRHGDRFWVENPNQPGSFTKDQLKELYKSSMARILCDTSDAVQTMQKYPFQLSSDKNPILKCKDVPSMDLSVWME